MVSYLSNQLEIEDHQINRPVGFTCQARGSSMVVAWGDKVWILTGSTPSSYDHDLKDPFTTSLCGAAGIATFFPPYHSRDGPVKPQLTKVPLQQDKDSK